MSKFDKFRSGLPQVGQSAAAGVPAQAGNSASANPLIAAAMAKAKTNVSKQESVVRRSARFAIALDATGSMAGLIKNAKAAISEIIRRISHEAGQPVEIQLLVYRDYDCPPQQLIETSPLSGNASVLIEWLTHIQPTGGGGNGGEAVEVALEQILKAEMFRAAMIAGDEPPNSRATLTSAGKPHALTAQQLAQRLGEAKTPVHTFVVGEDSRTVAAFKEIARNSGGQTGRLDGSAAMIDMAVLAMLAALKGAAAIKDYVDRTRLSASGQAFATLLLSGPIR